MSDILGPADAPNAVSIRPTETRSFSANDSWFRDCSSATADDGTDIQAAWLNGLAAALRAVARVNGGTVADPTVKIIPENGIDDNLLVKAIQHVIQRGQTNFAVDTGTVNSLVVTLSPALVEYKAGMTVRVKIGNTCTGPSVMTINGLGNKPIVHPDGSATAQNDLLAGEVADFNFDGVSFQKVGLSGLVLTAPRDYYVNVSTGNDANNGDNTHPFATIQHAVDVVSKLDANGYAVTIHVADGTYAPFTVAYQINGSLTIVGNATNWANCLISAPSGGASIAGYGAGVTFKAMGFRVANGAYGILSQAGALINFEKVDFNGVGGSHIFCDDGDVQCMGDYAITGSANKHAQVNTGTFVLTPSGFNTVTLSGGLGFSTMYAASDMGFIRANARTTFSGTASAVRFSAVGNSLINTSGAGASFFPGSAAGSTSSGGQYL